MCSPPGPDRGPRPVRGQHRACRPVAEEGGGDDVRGHLVAAAEREGTELDDQKQDATAGLGARPGGGAGQPQGPARASQAEQRQALHVAPKGQLLHQPGIQRGHGDAGRRDGDERVDVAARPAGDGPGCPRVTCLSKSIARSMYRLFFTSKLCSPLVPIDGSSGVPASGSRRSGRAASGRPRLAGGMSKDRRKNAIASSWRTRWGAPRSPATRFAARVGHRRPDGVGVIPVEQQRQRHVKEADHVEVHAQAALIAGLHDVVQPGDPGLLPSSWKLA